jgi:hypothetical protein
MTTDNADSNINKIASVAILLIEASRVAPGAVLQMKPIQAAPK